jgi:hypothetical protein
MTKTISTKNYLILGCILAVSVLLVFFLRHIYLTNKDNNIGVLKDFLPIIHEKEINDYLKENDSAIIYLSEKNTLAKASFEEDFKELITEYNLVDITVLINLDNFDYKKLEPYSNIKIDNYSNILIVEEGKIVDKQNSKQKVLTIEDTRNLLNEYGLIGQA